MRHIIPSRAGDKNSHISSIEPLSSEIAQSRIAHHFINDPRAKFILTDFGDVLNANIKAAELLDNGVLFQLPEGHLSYGSSDMNNAAADIFKKLRLGRNSCIRLLKRFEDDWMVLKFSSANFNDNKEVLLTVFPRQTCQEETLEALSKAFGFTITEAQVVRHMAMACCPKEIGLEMGISTNTVRAHLRSIYSKTGERGYNRALCLILQLTH